jgi:hypothetical protein
MEETKNYLSIRLVSALANRITIWEKIDEPNAGNKIGYKGKLEEFVIEIYHRERKDILYTLLEAEVKVLCRGSKELLARYSKPKNFIIDRDDIEVELDKIYARAEKRYNIEKNLGIDKKLRRLKGQTKDLQ